MSDSFVIVNKQRMQFNRQDIVNEASPPPENTLTTVETIFYNPSIAITENASLDTTVIVHLS